jgi:hypothetical protein
MSSLDWAPELAAALDELVPLDDSSSATWDDVVARVNRRRRLRLWPSRPRRRLRLAIVVALLLLLLAGVATATYLALRSSPRPGHYAGTTSEHQAVTFKVTDHGKRITRFTTVDGYNNMCDYTGEPPHIFHYTVKVPSMKIKRGGSFTATVKSTLEAAPGLFWGTFKVKGRFSSGRARGTVTRIGETCGSGASNPTMSDYLETFTAKRT